LTRDEYGELAELWGDATAAVDQDEVEQLARRTPRRARIAQWGELAIVLLLAATIGLSMVWNLGSGTALTGTLLLALLAWSAWSRHRLSNLALLIDERDRLSFVRSSVRAKEAELSRSALGLALIVPGIVISVLWAFSLRHPTGEADLVTFLVTIWTAPRGLMIMGLVIGAVLILGLAHLRVRRELAGLRELQKAYAEEACRDAAGH
jgi:uncharacterized integral membrane protein